ncbi:unnamed protein product, partial [Effrenium voratum]
VPLRHNSIDKLSERYYSQPAPYHGVLQLAIPKDWLSTGMSPNAVKPVSPLENMMAFILSMVRDSDDDEKLAKWRDFSRSVKVEYKICSNESELYFLAMNFRQNLRLDRDTMVFTTLQKMFSVLNCKTRLEKTHGPLGLLPEELIESSATRACDLKLYLPLGTETFLAQYTPHFRAANDEEKVSDSFVDTAVTLGKRVFSDDRLLNLLLKADEEPGNPFDSWTKLQTIVSKSRTQSNLSWVMFAVFDGFKNKHLPAEMLTYRAFDKLLNGKGTVDVLLGLLILRDHLFTEVAQWLDIG